MYLAAVADSRLSFHQTKLVRDHKELEKRGWDVSLCKTLCCGSEMQRSS